MGYSRIKSGAISGLTARNHANILRFAVLLLAALPIHALAAEPPANTPTKPLQIVLRKDVYIFDDLDLETCEKMKQYSSDDGNCGVSAFQISKDVKLEYLESALFDRDLHPIPNERAHSTPYRENWIKVRFDYSLDGDRISGDGWIYAGRPGAPNFELRTAAGEALPSGQAAVTEQTSKSTWQSFRDTYSGLARYVLGSEPEAKKPLIFANPLAPDAPAIAAAELPTLIPPPPKLDGEQVVLGPNPAPVANAAPAPMPLPAAAADARTGARPRPRAEDNLPLPIPPIPPKKIPPPANSPAAAVSVVPPDPKVIAPGEAEGTACQLIHARQNLMNFLRSNASVTGFLNNLKTPSQLEAYSACYAKPANNQRFVEQYHRMIHHAAQAYQIPEALLACLLMRESEMWDWNFVNNPKTKSSAGAMGIGQFMPNTIENIQRVLGQRVSDQQLADDQKISANWTTLAPADKTNTNEFYKYSNARFHLIYRNLQDDWARYFLRIHGDQETGYAKRNPKLAVPSTFTHFTAYDPAVAIGANALWIKHIMLDLDASLREKGASPISEDPDGKFLVDFLAVVAGVYNKGSGIIDKLSGVNPPLVSRWKNILSQNPETKNHMEAIRRCMEKNNSKPPCSGRNACPETGPLSCSLESP